MGVRINSLRSINPLSRFGPVYAATFQSLMDEVDSSMNYPVAENDLLFYFDSEGRELFKEKCNGQLPNAESVLSMLKKELLPHGGLDALKEKKLKVQEFINIENRLRDNIHFRVYDVMLEFSLAAYENKVDGACVYIVARPGIEGFIEKITIPLHSARGRDLVESIREIKQIDGDKEVMKEAYLVTRRNKTSLMIKKAM